MLENKKALKYYFMGIFANVTIGIFPLFWDLLRDIGSYTILLHRCFWTFSFLLPLVLFKRSFQEQLKFLLKDIFPLALSSCLIGVNWLTYIYAINHNHVLEASLAYFIAPLLTVFLSYIFLKEKMLKVQKIAILLAFISITCLFILKRVFPTYSLIIGGSFSLYGLMGRKIHSTIIFRICVETFFITSMLFLFFQNPFAFTKEFLHFAHLKQALFIMSGTMTILTFILLNTAIKHVQYSIIGIIGFIVPTLIFVLGIFYFHESIDREKFYVLLLLWFSVGLYIFGLRNSSKRETVPLE